MADPAAARVRRDFDRIAVLPGAGFDHNAQYHRFLLRALPARLGSALDVGCGRGDFSRLLAERAERVLGLDLSPEMVRIARERSRAHPHLTFEVADVAGRALPAGGFDCIASIATLHHLDADALLPRLAAALRPGGTLLVLDITRDRGPSDFARSALAVPLNAALRLWRTGRLAEPPAVRQAWREHGRHDRYLSLPEVRALARRALPAPAARVRRHFFWRYSLVWHKLAAEVRQP